MKYSNAIICLLISVLLFSGCQSLQLGKNTRKPGDAPELVAMRNQVQQYQGRTSALEASNSQINIQLAQTKQQLLSEQEANKRGSEYYKQMLAENERLKKENVSLIARNNEMVRQVQGLAQSVQVQGTTAIVPNNSVASSVNFSDLPDVYARRDGQYYKVSIPSEKIFGEDQITVSDSGKQLVSTVATRLASAFSQQQIRIEGHTSTIQPASTGNPSLNTPQKLTMAQAGAVSEVVTQTANIPEEKLVVTGCGASQPVVSSDSSSGSQPNQRIEFVVLP